MEYEEKIAALNDKIREFGERFNEKIQLLKADQSGKGIMTKELRQLYNDLNEKTTERKAIFEVVNAISSVISDLEEKREKLEKKLHPKYNKLDLLEKGIKEIERTITTTT